MLYTIEENYGSDIDNKRGTSEVFYEFEDTESEKEEIALKLYEDFKNGITEGIKEIYTWCPLICDEIKIEVRMENYLDELKMLEKSNCCNCDIIENTDLCSNCKEHTGAEL